MAMEVTFSNIDLERTCKPLYEQHQATAHAVQLDPDWDKTTADIYPGMVAMKMAGEVVTLSDGGATTAAWGLFAHFIAPGISMDESENDGMISVWRGGPDAVFQVLAPAFDVTKTWTEADDGTVISIVAGSGVNNRGKLCPAGADATAGYEVDASADVVGRLVKVVSDSEIWVEPYL